MSHGAEGIHWGKAVGQEILGVPTLGINLLSSRVILPSRLYLCIWSNRYQFVSNKTIYKSSVTWQWLWNVSLTVGRGKLSLLRWFYTGLMASGLVYELCFKHSERVLIAPNRHPLLSQLQSPDQAQGNGFPFPICRIRKESGTVGVC